MRQNKRELHLSKCRRIVRGGGRDANGAEGIPAESCTSLPEGLLHADGEELRLMFLVSFGMTHVNLCQNLRWSPGGQLVGAF